MYQPTIYIVSDTPYTSSLGPCWEAAWRLGRPLLGGSLEAGGDGGWRWRGGQASVDRVVVEANNFWPFVEERLLGTRSSREYGGINITRNLNHL